MTAPPTIARQTRFALPIADDVRMVTVETARAVFGFTAEEIFERTEDASHADYLPGFNLRVKGTARLERHIWAGCLNRVNWRQRATPSTLQDSIIADCLLTNLAGLPNREIHLHNSQLERAWSISNESLIRLIASKEITGVKVGRNWRVNRFSAAEFLRRRAL